VSRTASKSALNERARPYRSRDIPGRSRRRASARLRQYALVTTARLTRRYLSALTAVDEDVRWSAARELTDRGSWRLRIKLEQIARSDAAPDVRASAAWTLGFRGDTRAAGTLANLLANDAEDPVVRGHAAEALGHLLPFAPRDELVARAVMKGLDDPSADVRFWSAFAAATVPVPEAAPRLRTLAAEDEADVQGWWPIATEAEWALRVLDGDPNADDVLTTYPSPNDRQVPSAHAGAR
jgi:HEAT repeat protein